MQVEKITFDQIHTVWKNHLWPHRTSAIESHSAMTWPYCGDQPEFDITVFDQPAAYWAVFDHGKLIAVNSGHCSSADHYRSRGLWVDPAHRGKGLAQLLFQATEKQAQLEGCAMLWSIPRRSALRSYVAHGFNTVGDFFGTETSEANIYVIKYL